MTKVNGVGKTKVLDGVGIGLNSFYLLTSFPICSKRYLRPFIKDHDKIYLSDQNRFSKTRQGSLSLSPHQYPNSPLSGPLICRTTEVIFERG